MSVTMADVHDDDTRASDIEQLVMFYLNDQVFGLPIHQVRDVFIVSTMTRVPLAPAGVAGLFNLRGRVMTMLCMREMLGVTRHVDNAGMTAIGIEWRGESFGLVVDRIGEVASLSRSTRDLNPANLDPRWAGLSAGVYKLADTLLVELSLNALFNNSLKNAA
ncbi:MAG: chemotaxis protein CheW [Beijerinckiaceae bacterium]